MSILNLGDFIKSTKNLERTWKYYGKGIWLRRIGPFTIYMVIIIKEGRWTIRPAISKETTGNYGFEIPVDTQLKEAFIKELKEDELEEIHNHHETQHFHLTVESLERCVHLAKNGTIISQIKSVGNKQFPSHRIIFKQYYP